MSDRAAPPRRAVGAFVALFLAVALTALLFLRNDPLDLVIYRLGGRSVLSGTDTLYDAHFGPDLFFTYTPFAGLLFAPASVIPLRLVSVALFALSVAATVRSGWLVTGAVGGRAMFASLDRMTLTVLFAACSLMTEPYWSTLSYGQINLLIMWAVLEDYLGRPNRWRGIRIGLATGIKLVPGLFIVQLAVVGERRAFVRAVITATATGILGAILLPHSSLAYWTGIAYDGTRVGGVAYSGNQSINGALWRFLGPGGSTFLWAVGFVAVATVALVAAHALWRGGQRLESVCATACGALLISPISWSHHWVWATVFVFVLIAAIPPHRWRTTPATWLALAWVGCLLGHVIWWGPFGGDREYGASLPVKLASDAYVVLGALTLIWFCQLAWTTRKMGQVAAEAE